MLEDERIDVEEIELSFVLIEVEFDDKVVISDESTGKKEELFFWEIVENTGC